MSSLKLRSYRVSDKEAVWELHVLGLQQAGIYAGDGPWNDDVRQIDTHYLDNGGEFLVGEYEGRLVAMGAFRKTGLQEAEIKRMRTHPDFQGQGFGQQIYTALEARARQLGNTRLHLDTDPTLLTAQHLYTKNGFVETHRGEVHKGLPAIFYQKILE